MMVRYPAAMGTTRRAVTAMLVLSIVGAPLAGRADAASERQDHPLDEVTVTLDPESPAGVTDLTVTVTGSCSPGDATVGVLISQWATDNDMILSEEVASTEVDVDSTDGAFLAEIELPDAFPNTYDVHAWCGGPAALDVAVAESFTIETDPDLSLSAEPVDGMLGIAFYLTASGNHCPGEEVRIGVDDANVGLFWPSTVETVTPASDGTWTTTFAFDSRAEDSGTYVVHVRCFKSSASEANFDYPPVTFTVHAPPDVPPPAPPQPPPPDFTG